MAWLPAWKSRGMNDPWVNRFTNSVKLENAVENVWLVYNTIQSNYLLPVIAITVGYSLRIARRWEWLSLMKKSVWFAAVCWSAGLLVCWRIEWRKIGKFKACWIGLLAQECTNRLLKSSQSSARQYLAKKRGLHTLVNEHFEPYLNAVACRLRVFQQPAGASIHGSEAP